MNLRLRRYLKMDMIKKFLIIHASIIILITLILCNYYEKVSTISQFILILVFLVGEICFWFYLFKIKRYEKGSKLIMFENIKSENGNLSKKSTFLQSLKILDIKDIEYLQLEEFAKNNIDFWYFVLYETSRHLNRLYVTIEKFPEKREEYLPKIARLEEILRVFDEIDLMDISGYILFYDDDISTEISNNPIDLLLNNTELRDKILKHYNDYKNNRTRFS